MKKNQKKLTHFDEKRGVKMVEVTEKPDTVREAAARGFIHLSEQVINLIEKGRIKKGDPLEVAKIAGIMAAKKTHELIPLCHPLMLTNVAVDLELRSDGVKIESKVTTIGKTGVEMEALTAVSIAALTVYDMCKAVDKEMVIGDIFLVKKRGGRTGDFMHPRVS